MSIVENNIACLENKQIILLTGVTGALGSELLTRLLTGYTNHSIVILVRAKCNSALQDRISAVYAYCNLTLEQQNKIYAISSDICKYKFGLNDSQYKILANNVVDIFHLAANVEFDLPFEDSYNINVVSTKHILAFAKQAAFNSQFRRLNYVSTAYIAGDRRGQLKESELYCGQKFYNGYERSKFEAECLMETEKCDLPITIFRPSMIIGNSKTGKTKKFFAFYDFLKIAGLTTSRLFLANPEAKMDLVPSDYVADAIYYFSTEDFAIGKTYHLTAGLNRSLKISEIVDAVFSSCKLPRHYRKPQIVDANTFWQSASDAEIKKFKSTAVSLLLKVYEPYLAYERDFETATTTELLAKQGIVMPDIKHILPIIVEYAISKRYKS